MKNTDIVIKSILAGALALTAIDTLVNSTDAFAAQNNSEKCYGVSKAGKNDCQTSTQSCAGSSTKDKQPDAFILVPKGMCEKIGGSLSPKTDGEKNQ